MYIYICIYMPTLTPKTTPIDRQKKQTWIVWVCGIDLTTFAGQSHQRPLDTQRPLGERWEPGVFTTQWDWQSDDSVSRQ